MRSYIFGGLDRVSGHEAVPDWYRPLAPDGHPARDAGLTFQAAVQATPGVTTVPLAYWDADAGDYVEMAGHVAVVNPAWLGADADCPKADAAWTSATDTYDPVPAMHAYGPLIAAVHAHADTDTAEVFGVMRTYRHGGEVHFDVFFPGAAVTLRVEGDDRPIIPGLQTGYSHYGDRQLYAQPIAIDAGTGAVMRRLDERHGRRHVKSKTDAHGRSTETVAAWWDRELTRMFAMRDAILTAVGDATAYTVEFLQPTFGPVEFLSAAGLPEAIATDAIDAFARPDVESMTAFGLYHAVTRYLTERYTGKVAGAALRGHVAVANRLLFAPARVEADVLGVWRASDDATQVDVTDHDGETTPATTVLDDRLDRLDAVVADYRDVRARVRAQLKAAAEDDPDETTPAAGTGSTTGTGDAPADGGEDTDETSHGAEVAA